MQDMKPAKEEVGNIIESSLRNNGYDVTRVDYHTLSIRIRHDQGLHYLEVSVKERY